MKHKTRKILVLMILLVGSIVSHGQTRNTSNSKINRNYPDSFNIELSVFQEILKLEPKTQLNSTFGQYLDNAVMLSNIKSGDMQFVRLKLQYFKKAYLQVQVNGAYSTQFFILSDDKSAFYKGFTQNNHVVMKKCSRDDIYME